MPWHCGGAVAGRVHASKVPVLLAAGGALCRDGDRLAAVGADFAERSSRFAELVAALVARGELRPPLGEFYPVTAGCSPEPLLQIDRTAVATFGVRARGIHGNGWSRSEDGCSLWIARRSRGKRTFPGHLDNLVGGGQSIDLTAQQTLVKECHEEAGIPPALAARAVPAGTITYAQQDGATLKPDLLACFDLELPTDFVPHPVDGEVECFEAWPVARVAASLRGDDPWKPNSALVALDFLLRHGVLDGEVPAAERWRLWSAMRGALP